MSTQPFSTIHVINGSDRKANGTGDQPHNLVWELGYFLRCSPVEGRTEWSSLVGSICTHELFWLRLHVWLGHEAEYFG